MKRFHWVPMFALVAVSCGSPAPSEAPGAGADTGAPLDVYVSSYPLQYFAERIGGDRVAVTLPVPQGTDPADWSPDAETVASYQSADLILLNGAEYEKWLTKVSLPPSKLVDTSAAFADRLVFVANAVTHSHGPEGEHSHGETSSVTWLDMTLAVEQAKAIRDAFTKARPADQAYFDERLEGLTADLMSIDHSIQETVAEKTQRPLLAAYPVYPYLARRYQLDIDSLRYDPADMTGHDFWHDLEHTLEEHKAHWMFWGRAPSSETAEKLRGYGVEIIVFDPCGARPPEGDFLSVMRSNVANLARAFAD